MSKKTHSKVALQEKCWSESIGGEGFTMKIFIIERLRISANVTLNFNPRYAGMSSF